PERVDLKTADQCTMGLNFTTLRPRQEILADCAPQAGMQRNSLAGPHYYDTDVSLTKNFGLPSMKVLGEKAGLSFRADAFNLFNKTNINGGQQAAGGGGGIDNVLGTVNPNGTINSVNGDFGVSNSAFGSRVVEIQTRFSF
ncbi:MAG: hypothetical protein ACLQHT_00130, partial [Terracidiphilus sp.]